MRKILVILFLLFCSYAEAGISVCSDANGKVTSFSLRGNSVNGCLWFDAGQNITMQQDEQLRQLLKNTPRKYLKVVTGVVQEMNTTEKAQADMEEQAIINIIESQAVDKLQVSNEDIIMALVQVINLRLPVDKKITKTEIIQQIKANKGL